MELIYRGIKYIADDPKLPARIGEADKNKINPPQSNQIQINANFPLFGYLKQLFSRSESKPVFDPITFWYIHKRKYLENCWPLDEREKFERCWELTLKLKPQTHQKSGRALPGCEADRPSIKLKYRGVTYYR